MDRVRNKLSLPRNIIIVSPRFRSNCRHFSRFDFHACRASISKVNRHTPRTLRHPSNLLLFASGRNRGYMYVFRLASYRGGFQYSRNIATPRIVAPLPYFSHANAYMRDHRVCTFPCDFTEYQLCWTTNDRQSWQLCVMSSVLFLSSPFSILFVSHGRWNTSLQYYTRLLILHSNCEWRGIECSLSRGLKRSLLLWE